MALLTKNQQEIVAILLIKIFMALFTKKKKIGANLLMKIFMALLTQNQQEIGAKSTRNRD